MKKYPICLLLILNFLITVKAQTQLPSTTSFNAGWEFVKDIDTAGAGHLLSATHTPAISWEKISLPHTAHIEPVNKVKETMAGNLFLPQILYYPHCG